jgi:predicted protein tyrosine phosphatase
MNIFVCSKSEVDTFIKDKSITHLISILDVKDTIPVAKKFNKNNKLTLFFDDTFDKTNLFAPSKQDVIDILNWTALLPEDANLLIHCFAGISRSTAVALAVLVQKYKNVDKAIKQLQIIRPIACPNSIISELADEILEMNGELYEKSELLIKNRLLFVF